MDIMKPRCVWIEGICYRKNTINPIFQKDVEKHSKQDNYNQDDTIWNDDNDCHYSEENLDIQKLGDNRYQLNLSLPSAFFGNIIGAKGSTKKRLETETRVRIAIPKGDQGDIIITGPDIRSIESAKTRIDVITDAARQRMPFTHFISIPLNSQCIKSAFMDFKDEVCRKCDGNRGLDSTIFQNPDKLHLTICTLVLLDATEREKAASLLLECKKEIIQPLLGEQQLDICIEGIEYMNDDPAEVDVLYAKVHSADGTNKLQQLADRLVDVFSSSGFMQKQYDRVKLHLTIMNTVYRTVAPGNLENGHDKKQRVTFDARSLLKNYEKHTFGTVEIRSIHLSQLHTTGKDGFYAASSNLNIP